VNIASARFHILCYSHKYTKTEAIDPLTKQTVPLFHPRLQMWREHFGWNQDCSLMIGLTPTGRASIAALRMNRFGVVNLRQLLYAAGKHPPGGFESNYSGFQMRATNGCACALAGQARGPRRGGWRSSLPTPACEGAGAPI
jgi:hypothetical protein